MRIYIKISLKYIKNYFYRSLSIMISMIIGIALIVGIGTLSKSAKQADIDRMKYEFGDHHVIFEDVNKQQLNEISNSRDVETIGLTRYYDSNTDTNQMLNLMEVNEEYLDLANTKIIEGRMPTKPNEILLEPWVITNLGLEPELGQEITLDLYDKGKKETYTLVGIVEDRVSEKSMGIKQALLLLDSNNTEKADAYVKFNENSNIVRAIDQIKSDINVDQEDVKINKMLIESLSNNFKLDYKMIVMVLIISLFSSMVVYSIFNISILQRISEYGTLKAIGSTAGQLFCMIISELSMLLSISIPVGITLGIIGAKVCSSTIGSIFIEGNTHINKIVISTQSMLLAVILTLLTIVFISILVSIKMKKISPINAIRKVVKHKKLKNRIPTRVLIKYISITKIVSLKNISRNRKCFFTTILSMTLGGTIFIVSNFSSTLQKTNAELSLKTYAKINSDYKIVQESMDMSNGISEHQLEELKNLDGVSSVEGVQVNYMGMDVSVDDVKFPNYFDDINNSNRYSKLFNGVFTKNKNNEDYMIKGNLYGYQSSSLEDLNLYLTEGEIDVQKMENEDIALLRMPKDGKGNYVFNIKPGDKIKFRFPKDSVSTEETIKLPDNIEYIEKEYVVGGIIDDTTSESEYFVGDKGVDIIISDTKFKEISNIKNFGIVNINKKSSANTTELNRDIYQIISKTPGCVVRDLSEEVEKLNSFTNAKLIFINGITIILLLISFFNIINNISYNLVSRISEFSIIRAMGISDKEFKQMIIFEGLIYGIVSSILTVLLSLIGQSIVYNKLSPMLINPKWFINYKMYIFIVLINLLIGFIATYLPSKKIQSKSIVESISSLE